MIPAALLSAAAASWLLGYAALRVGWIDQREGQEFRKPDLPPVALVGGAAILIGILTAIGLDSVGSYRPLETFTGWMAIMPWPGLVAAFVLGLADDLAPRGMSALLKLSGQLLVGSLVALHPGAAFEGASALQCIGLGALAVVAMNAVNLFDHADGLVGLLGMMALVAAKPLYAPVAAAAAAGYLPFNLVVRRRSRRSRDDWQMEPRRSAPWAMLGDSGSHVVGVLLATSPGAWWFLLIPVLDMLRVAHGRRKRGASFWRGDRTHVGHLLEEIEFSPVARAVLVGVAMCPPLVALLAMASPAALAASLLGSAALYFGILVLADGDAIGRSEVPLDPEESSAGLSDVFARATGESGPSRGEPGRRPSGAVTQASGTGSDDPEGPSGPFAAPSQGPAGANVAPTPPKTAPMAPSHVRREADPPSPSPEQKAGDPDAPVRRPFGEGNWGA